MNVIDFSPGSIYLTGKEADELEALLGVHVLRHAKKKPAGGKAELEAYFGCPAEQLVMVGDRYAVCAALCWGTAPQCCLLISGILWLLLGGLYMLMFWGVLLSGRGQG